jgi:hypothetical protein
LQEALSQLNTEPNPTVQTPEQTFDLSKQATNWQFLEDDIDQIMGEQVNPFKALFQRLKDTISQVKISLHHG